MKYRITPTSKNSSGGYVFKKQSSGPYILNRSNEDCWSNPTENVMSLIDDDNGIDLIIPSMKKKQRFDYCDLAELWILLCAYKEHDKNSFGDYEISISSKKI